MLAGKGVMMNWSNVAPRDRPAYRHWHTAEHMVGRLSIPGFLRGRRYGAVEASRDILVFYELADSNVPASAAYLARANEPVGELRNSLSVSDGLRNIADVRLSLGIGIGGVALTLRLEVPPTAEAELTEHLVTTALPAVATMGQISGAHFCLGEPEVSSIVPTYLKGRLTTGPRWIVMVEGMTVEAVKAAFEAHLAGLERYGCSGPITPDIFGLEVMLTR